VKGGRIPHLVLHLASGVTLDVSFNEPSVQTAAQLVMEYVSGSLWGLGAGEGGGRGVHG
jgi:hypothetical protein